MAGDGPSTEGSGGQTGETLSCVSCRNRKLKCDRTKPKCKRCEKAKLECTYPESRKKTAFKRNNVKELEARLAQVEVLLKEASQNRGTLGRTADLQPTEEPLNEDVLFQGADFTGPSFSFDDVPPFSFQESTANFSGENLDEQGQENTPLNELMDLGGIFESLPPFEVMEDLNRIFFDRQQHLIPIIHPTRYLQSFYSPPHMKPPMSLQYAIWALAAHGHPKYGPYHEIFYRRARQYADSEEMKGFGEHFMTVPHAQAWCVIATYEAKSMLFTRAAMSCSRAVRLSEMMGLHRLDGSAEEMSVTLLPPKDWAELEERRRVFWGVFCMDSHCSISTGWPFLIDASEVTTHLPASEYAFQSGEKVETCTLNDAFKGHQYSSFAGAVMVCHIFNQILKHVHKPKPNDNPDNYEYGEYWQRHRDLDNTLSGAFMYLPEALRLPENYRDSVAVHTNLNLHASIICLHHSAIDRIDTYKLPESAKKICHDRLTTAAQEIVNIVKLTSHVNSSPKSPLAALSLYCAASVYVYLCAETRTATHADNLDFLITAMEALGREHLITKHFLRQVVVDIERNDIRHIVRLPRLDDLGEFNCDVSHNIPLLARSKISRHSEVQSPLPGRLPLGKPMGKIIDPANHGCEYGTWTSQLSNIDAVSQESPHSSQPTGGNNHNNNHKRKRTSPSTGDSTLGTSSEDYDSPWTTSSGGGIHTHQQSVSANASIYPDPTCAAAFTKSILRTTGFGAFTGQKRPMGIPHRTGSPSVGASDTPPQAQAQTQTQTPAPAPPPLPQDISNNNGHNTGVHIAPSMLGAWDLVSMYMHAQLSGPEQPDAANGEAEGGGGNADGDEYSPWGFAGGGGTNVDWGTVGAGPSMSQGGGVNTSGGTGT
ncbi:fungal-specific transcription factor domain-containing protein [Hypomontagnella monticulosa]|nr:fungal-specific transcription factor domain-containing protein [Hypomontagnella monticulosa]